MNNEKRWKQRFENFEKSFNLFCGIKKEYEENPDSEPYQLALIKSYEISVELSWNTLKDYLINSGYDVETPKKVIRQAFRSEVITQAEEWMEAITNRNRTSHIYRASILKEILAFINDTYFSILRDLYYILKKEIDSSKEN